MMDRLGRILELLGEMNKDLPALIADLDQMEAALIHECLPGREAERDELLAEVREIRAELLN